MCGCGVCVCVQDWRDFLDSLFVGCCFAVAPCPQATVSDEVRLALAFIILLRLSGISHRFSTHSVLGPFFAAAFLGLSSGRRVSTSGPHRLSALGAYIPLLRSVWCAAWDRSLLRPCSASIGVASARWVLSLCKHCALCDPPFPQNSAASLRLEKLLQTAGLPFHEPPVKA